MTDDFSSDDEDTVRATLSLQVRSIVPDDADVGAWQLTLRSSTRKVKLPMASPAPENCVGLGAALLDELALDDSDDVDSAADAPGVSDAATFCCCSDAAEESGAPSGTPPFDSARWATSAAASVLPARASPFSAAASSDFATNGVFNAAGVGKAVASGGRPLTSMIPPTGRSNCCPLARLSSVSTAAAGVAVFCGA